VPSPGAGVVLQILVQEGETVDVGTRLAVVGPAGASAPAAAPPPEPATQRAADEANAAASEGVGAVAPSSQEEADAERQASNGKTFVSPVVARIASEHGVDVAKVPGTGRGGRVTKKDILAFIETGGSTPTLPQVPVRPPAPGPAEAPVGPPPTPRPAPDLVEAGEPGPGETFEPMTAMRRGVADHMRRSVDTSAHVTSAIEVDMSRIAAIREKLKSEYQRSYGVNPTYLAFIARATTETLREWPWVNGELRGDRIVTRNYVNLGIAVALEGGKGLIVPVIKNAEEKNLLGMARAIADLAERARTKKLLPDDVSGGTFTITNPGGFGTLHGTPIINQPQVAILGTYAIVKRAWVVEDEFGNDVVAIRPIMNLTLTYDHRLVDGAYAGGFLRDLRDRLQSMEGE
jgi:pyruvate/2-oxoglutarate dehydrogenase complex dihydrolipoamide acyltransferase (E2) component